MRLFPLLLLALPASALQLQLDDAQLCGLSSHVVVGEITSSEVRWAEGDEGGIETHVWLAVDEVVRGPQTDTIHIVLPGGEIDGLRHWVEDVPMLVENHSYTLFLFDTPMGNMIVGGDQGVRYVKPRADRTAVAESVKDSVGSCVAP